MLTERVCAEISRLTEEALAQLMEQPGIVDRVTVIRGYLRLSLLHPETQEYVLQLAEQVRELAKFAQHRGCNQLAEELSALLTSLPP